MKKIEAIIKFCKLRPVKREFQGLTDSEIVEFLLNHHGVNIDECEVSHLWKKIQQANQDEGTA